MTRGERNVLVIFLVTGRPVGAAVTASTLSASTNGVVTAVTDHLNEGSVVVLAAAMLFFLPRGNGSGDSTLTWPRPPRSTGALSSSSALA